MGPLEPVEASLLKGEGALRKVTPETHTEPLVSECAASAVLPASVRPGIKSSSPLWQGSLLPQTVNGQSSHKAATDQ